MISSISRPGCFFCHDSIKIEYIRRIGIIGAGDVFRSKILPALEINSHLLDDVIVCSAEPPSQVSWMPYRYLPVESGSLLPFDELRALGFLDGTIWIIATQPEYHVHYAVQLAGLCKVAIEKPIASNARQAKLLRPFASQIYTIDHKIFNASPLSFIRRLRRDPSPLDAIGRIEGVFYESEGIAKGRQSDDTISDIQYHLLVVLHAILKSSGAVFDITIDRVFTSRHRADADHRFQVPSVCTSSLIAGLIRRNGRRIHFDLRQAKGAPVNQKLIKFFDSSDRLIEEVDMNESGPHAHVRIVGSLLQPIVDMRHTYEDSISIMEILDTCKELASEQKDYEFGQLPEFLEPAIFEE